MNTRERACSAMDLDAYEEPDAPRATCGTCGSAFERRDDGKVRCEWCPIPEPIEDERPTAPIAPESMDAVVWERRR